VTTATRNGISPSAVSEATHTEWTVCQIIIHLGLSSGIRRLEEEVGTFHARQNISLSAAEIASFQGQRPEGVAFDSEGKQCVFIGPGIHWPYGLSVILG